MASATNLQTDAPNAITNPNDWEVVTITGAQSHSPYWPNRWGFFHRTTDWHVSPGGVHVRWGGSFSTIEEGGGEWGGAVTAEYPTDEVEPQGGELLFAPGALVTLGDWVDLGNVWPTLGDGTVIGEQSSFYTGDRIYSPGDPDYDERDVLGERLVVGEFCKLSIPQHIYRFGDDVTIGSYAWIGGDGYINELGDGCIIGDSWNIGSDTDIGAGTLLGRVE